MGIEDVTRDGLASITRLGRRLGLPTGDLRVLSARGNLLVHLAPAPVLARVVTLTAAARSDPAAWVAREIGVSAWAADRGGPVAPPTALVDPGPHDADGLVVGLLEFRASTPGRTEGRELGEALAALHAATAGYPGVSCPGWRRPTSRCARVSGRPQPGCRAAPPPRCATVMHRC